MRELKHDPADACTCSYCGIKEDIHLLDGVLTKDEKDSGLLACIKCYPTDGWCCGSPKMTALSIAPSLKPLYDDYVARENSPNNAGRSRQERRPTMNADKALDAINPVNSESRWPWGTRKCSACDGKSYLVCDRSDGRRAIERCDECSSSFLSDEQAAVIARRDGIDCEEIYPCYVKGDQT